MDKIVPSAQTPRMPEVKFARYRQYLDQRQLVNSAVMALLAGSHLANHTLQLTRGSDRPLREIFPRVPHIDRFNLKTDMASRLLADAEEHLSAMAIPYILTIFEALFGTFEDMLVASGTPPNRRRKTTSPVWIVKDHWDQVGEKRDKPSWLVLTLLTHLRHDIIHRAAAAGADTVIARQALTPDAESLWERMAGEPAPSFQVGERHKLDHADMIVCLAVTKFLASEGNTIMQKLYPRALWLRDFVSDAATTQGFGDGNPSQRARRLRTFARRYYDPMRFTLAEVEQEIVNQ